MSPTSIAGAWLAAATLAGAVGGSFATTAGLRWARGEQVLTGRSHCDVCAVPLGFGQTAPIVSYLRLGGACAACRSAIDPSHLIGELAGAGVVLISFMTLPAGPAMAVAALGLVLIGAASADVCSQRIPNLASLVVGFLGAALAFERGSLALLSGVIAALVGATMLLGVRGVFLKSRGGPGLGLGDVKLVAALALWLGALSPWMIALAGLLGLAKVAIARQLGRRPVDGRYAFGPFLALAGWTLGLALQAGLFGDVAP